MRAVVQRVSRASVRVDGKTVADIGKGLLVLLGIAKGDGEADAQALVEKLATLRIFGDQQGKMNLSVTDLGPGPGGEAGGAGGSLLVVSQFTLLGDTAKGRRPGFDLAAPPEDARRLYGLVVERLKGRGLSVQTGVFGAHMDVELVNDGPVTLLLDCNSGRTV